jgi:hypothetical protein
MSFGLTDNGMPAFIRSIVNCAVAPRDRDFEHFA